MQRSGSGVSTTSSGVERMGSHAALRDAAGHGTSRSRQPSLARFVSFGNVQDATSTGLSKSTSGSLVDMAPRSRRIASIATTGRTEPSTGNKSISTSNTALAATSSAKISGMAETRSTRNATQLRRFASLIDGISASDSTAMQAGGHAGHGYTGYQKDGGSRTAWSNASSKLSRAASALSTVPMPPSLRKRSTKIVWRQTHEGELMLASKTVVKDLPITRRFDNQLAVQELADLVENIKKQEEMLQKLDNSSSQMGVSELLLNYSRAAVRVLRKVPMIDVEDIREDIENQAEVGRGNKALLSNAKLWCRVQTTMIDAIMQRNGLVSQLVKEIERYEEENSLLRDFVDQHSMYSPERTVEIQVKQIVRVAKAETEMVEKQTDTVDLLPPDDPLNLVNGNAVAGHSQGHGSRPVSAKNRAFGAYNRTRSLLDGDSDDNQNDADLLSALSRAKNAKDCSVQTDPVKVTDPEEAIKEDEERERAIRRRIEIEGDVKIRDVYDKASGTDKPIPTYRVMGVMADLPHPVEAKFAELTRRYQALLSEKESAGVLSDHMINDLKAKYEGQIAIMKEKMKQKIESLERTRDALEKSVQKYQDDIRDFEFERNKNLSEISEFQMQITYYRKEVDGLKTMEQSLQRENEMFKNKVKAAQAEAKLAESRAASAVAELNEQKKANEIMLKRQEELQDALLKTEQERDSRIAELVEAEKLREQLKTQISQLSERVAEIESTNVRLEAAAKDAIAQREVVQDKNDELERIIGELMKYPESEFGPDFKLKNMPLTHETHMMLRQMIETNNIRIMLLERKNQQYRDIQMQQASVHGHENWSLYHPAVSTTLLFDRTAVERPKTADSEAKSDKTYIIGSIDGSSRPVSASSVRLLRPRSSLSRVMPTVKNVVVQSRSVDGSSGSKGYKSRPMSAPSRGSKSQHSYREQHSHDASDDDVLDDHMDAISTQLYDSHYPPRQLMSYFRAKDADDTIERLNNEDGGGSVSSEDYGDFQVARTKNELSERQAQMREPWAHRRDLLPSRPATAGSRPTTAGTQSLSVSWAVPTVGGGGGKFPYPKWVWSFYGGWWPKPKHAFTNSLVSSALILGCYAYLFNLSAKLETRHTYPKYWIPSMLWAKEFHDPKSVAYWKERLAQEGREWIEPIPDWWPFKARKSIE